MLCAVIILEAMTALAILDLREMDFFVKVSFFFFKFKGIN